MCQSALNVETGEEVNSIGHFRKMSSTLFWCGESGDHLPDESCLCWLDIPNTLIWSGYRVWRNSHMAPEYLFDKVPENSAGA